MADLLTTMKIPAFGCYPKQIKLDKATGQPKNPINDVMSSPDHRNSVVYP